MIRRVAFLLALALAVPACKKSADETSGGPASSSSESQSVAKLIQGYWLPSADSLFEMEKSNLEANPPAGGVSEALLAQVRAQIEASVGAFILHIEGGKTRALGDDRVETGTYALSDTDDTSGTFTATLAEDGGETVTGEGSVSGDSMKLSTTEGAPPMGLDRTTKAEWDRRMAELNDRDD